MSSSAFEIDQNGGQAKYEANLSNAIYITNQGIKLRSLLTFSSVKNMETENHH